MGPGRPRIVEEQRREDRDHDQRDDDAAGDDRDAVLAEAAPEQLQRASGQRRRRRRPGSRASRPPAVPQRVVKLIPRRDSSLAMCAILTCASTSAPNLHLRRGRERHLPADLGTGPDQPLAGHTQSRGYPLRRRGQSGAERRRPGGLGRRRRPAAGRADPPAQPRRSSSASRTCSARARRCAPRSSRAARTRWCSTDRPGSGKTTLARIVAESSGAAFEELSAVAAGRAEVRAVIERARAPPRHRRPADGPLPRRDPPLQQGPAGRAAAGRRGGARDADRRDDREPRLRGQRRAALAPARVRAAGSSAPRSSSGCWRARPRGDAPAGRRRRRCASSPLRSEGDARTALNALELAGGDGRRERRARRSRWRASRTRCSAARCSTTKAATATTTTPRPGSRRPAARTRTPPSTTWR